MTTERKLTIGIVDLSSVKYFGSNVETEFLPPAQTAIINIAEELFKIGFFITVFNSGNETGLHNFVQYQSLEALNNRDYQFDIVISIDSIVPFLPDNNTKFEQLQRSNQLKILWAHSVDFEGCEQLEELIYKKQIDQIFTIGDRHTNDLINRSAYSQLAYETLSNNVFQTRYGVREGYKNDPYLYGGWGKFKTKREQFAFNYTDFQSAELLIEKIWPRIKEKLPNTELLVVADPFKEDFNQLRSKHDKINGIKFFTDNSYRSRMSSLSECSLSLYPSLLWNNDYVSLLECVSVNVPVLGFATSSFIEVVGKNAGILVQNTDDQDIDTLIAAFADTAVLLVNEFYRHQQYVYGCNLTKEILSWSTVAIQWKQYFYSFFDLPLLPKEQHQAQWINYRVNEITEKNFVNSVEISVPVEPVKIDPIKYSPLTLAFIDLSGNCYDGATLQRRQLGIRESAVINVSRALAAAGFRITVFNSCTEGDCQPGVYNDVEYLPITLIQEQSAVYDVVVSVESPEIFADQRQSNIEFGNSKKLSLDSYDLLKKSRYRVLWLQDRFIPQNQAIQQMVLQEQFDELWTTDDFHTNHFLNSNIGLSSYALLKPKIWTTRNSIDNIDDWDDIALEWKQRIYQKHDRYLSRSETQKVNYTANEFVKRTGRKTANHRNQVTPVAQNENRLIIVSTFRNAGKLVENCILSVAAQNYSNYHHILVNDCSTDHSAFVAQLTIQNLPEDIQSKFTLINREQNYGAVYNQIDVIRQLQNNEVVLILDGDDFLANRTDIFSLYNEIYNQGAEFTYGSSWSQADKVALIGQPYDDYTLQTRNYRSTRFNWYIPYTPLRTFRKYLINNIPDGEFQDDKSQWFRAGGDVAVFYALIEQARPESIRVVNDIVYIYNDNLFNNDSITNRDEQSRNSLMIIKGDHRNKINKRVLIAVPTHRYIEPQTFKAIYDQHCPKNVDLDFRYFYGQNTDRTKNLIAQWAINGYDYVWIVDDNISFHPNTIAKLLEHNQDIVTAVYRQPIPGTDVVELYERSGSGMRNISWESLQNRGLVEVDACGFGCVLIKSQVLRDIGHPQFEYSGSIDNEHTAIEDLDFCSKARNRGYKIYADTSILCDRYGHIIFGLNQ